MENELDINKILHNKLKSIPIDQLEAGIAKVVSDLVGEDYRCNIGNIKYSIFSGAEFTVRVELTASSNE
ncbi:MAG TPA: hypothetical protein VHP30_04305 [Ignavibacteriales bacterium]|jgi:hypothetical protein|nr:hypothetical protein [Ignavibacteriales bacterium]